MEKANAPNQEPHARKGPADDKVMPCFCQSANLPEEARLPERGPPPRARFTPGGGGNKWGRGTGGKGERKEGTPHEWWRCGGPKRQRQGKSGNGHCKLLGISWKMRI